MDKEREEIKKFIELIKDTDIEEINWESPDLKISLKRQESSLIIPETEIKKETNNKSTKQNNVKENKDVVTIKSPMVGTFYRSQSIDHPPFVVEGNHVVPGQKVAIIEAMKIMKDVVSSVKGKIVKILIENGQSVEYGQDLFLIDTAEEKQS